MKKKKKGSKKQNEHKVPGLGIEVFTLHFVSHLIFIKIKTESSILGKRKFDGQENDYKEEVKKLMLYKQKIAIKLKTNSVSFIHNTIILFSSRKFWQTRKEKEKMKHLIYLLLRSSIKVSILLIMCKISRMMQTVLNIVIMMK